MPRLKIENLSHKHTASNIIFTVNVRKNLEPNLAQTPEGDK